MYTYGINIIMGLFVWIPQISSIDTIVAVELILLAFRKMIVRITGSIYVPFFVFTQLAYVDQRIEWHIPTAETARDLRIRLADAKGNIV